MKRAAHRVIDRAVKALTPADGATPFRPAQKTCEPEEFFTAPGEPPVVSVEGAKRKRLGRVRTIRKRFAFESPVRSGVEANDTVRGYWFSPLQRGVRASVVFLQRWKATSVRPMRRMAQMALRQGAEVLVPAQPYHAWRRPKLTYSGMTMVTPDLDMSLRAMRQAVLDVRCLLAWLQERESGPILLVGIDVGGLVAGLTATVHEGLGGLVVVGAHDRFGDSLWGGGADRGRFRDALERAGADRDDLEEAWAVLDPGWRPPLLPLEKVLLVGGRFDEVCTPEGIARLAERWGGARVSMHDFAHGSTMLAGRAIMKESLALIGLSG